MFLLAAFLGQKLDCSRVTRRGHAPSSWVRAGGAAPEPHVGAQEAGPAARPLPRRRGNPGERELATGGDRGGEGNGGLGFDGGGGTGGRGSPPESKFPPGEDEGGMRVAKSRARDSGTPAFLVSDPGVLGPNPLLPGTWNSQTLSSSFLIRTKVCRSPRTRPSRS